MKIVQVNKFFYPKGGSEQYYFDLCELLEQAGHDVVHFSMQHPNNRKAPFTSPYEKYFVSEVDFSPRKRTAKNKLRMAKQFVWSHEAERSFAQLLADTRPDIIHVHNIAHQLTPSILRVAQLAGIPVVHTLHDYQLLCPSYNLFTQGSPCERCKTHQYWNAIRYKCVQNSRAASLLSAAEMAYHNILKKSYKNGVARFIAPSHFLRDKLIDWGWNENQVVYIPNMVTVQAPAQTAPAVDGQYVAFLGRLHTTKGVDTLIEAAQLLQENEKTAHIQIKIAGSGPQEEEYKKRVQQLELANVEFVGFVSGAQKMEFITGAQAVVIPSTWYENAPITAYEALTLGVPIIGADIGGIPELVTPNETGYLFTPQDAKGLAKNIEMCYRNPLSVAPNTRFAPASHLAQIESLYNAVIENSQQ